MPVRFTSLTHTAHPSVGLPRLNDQSNDTGDYECCTPYHVEIQPSFAKNCEANLSIDYPGDEPGYREIPDRMHSSGENCCRRAGGRGCVVMACHMVRSL